MTDHTPEPWMGLIGKDGRTLGNIPPERVLACVNACAGIPTDELGDVKALVEASRRAMAWLEHATRDQDLHEATDEYKALAVALADFPKN